MAIAKTRMGATVAMTRPRLVSPRSLVASVATPAAIATATTKISSAARIFGK